MSDNPTPKANSSKVQVEGAPLNWTDEEIEALANISPAVIADARADARQDPILAALLNAKPIDESDDKETK